MNKSQALELLNQIAAICQSLNVSGFYTRPIRFVGGDSVELRLMTSLDGENRRKLASIVSGRGLKMVEEKGLVIIYEPSQSTR